MVFFVLQQSGWNNCQKYFKKGFEIYLSYSFLCKVLLSPHAVIADGGAICSSGHLMVATAAKVCFIFLLDSI